MSSMIGAVLGWGLVFSAAYVAIRSWERKHDDDDAVRRRRGW